MTSTDIELMTREQRDELLMLFLKSGAEAQSDTGRFQMPKSQLGRNVLQWVTDDLLDEIGTGHIGDAIDEECNGLTSWIDGCLADALDDVIDAFAEEISGQVLSKYIGALKKHGEWILRRRDPSFSNALYEKLVNSMAESTCPEAVEKLRNQFLISVHRVVHDSIQAKVDDENVLESIKADLVDHLQMVVLPQYARTIHEHEAELEGSAIN